MTVVPAEHLMTLICDGCGDSVTGAGCVPPDAEVVWTLVFEHDWVGPPFASGPHHCPRCGVPAEGDDAGPGPDELDEVGADPSPPGEDLVDPVRRALSASVVPPDRELVDLTPVEAIDPAGVDPVARPSGGPPPIRPEAR